MVLIVLRRPVHTSFHLIVNTPGLRLLEVVMRRSSNLNALGPSGIHLPLGACRIIRLSCECIVTPIPFLIALSAVYCCVRIIPSAFGCHGLHPNLRPLLLHSSLVSQTHADAKHLTPNQASVTLSDSRLLYVRRGSPRST